MRLALHAATCLGDVVAIVGAFLLADWLRFSFTLTGYGLRSAATVLPAYLLAAVAGAAYSSDTLRSGFSGAGRAVRALAIALTITLVMLFSMKVSEEFSRLVFALGAGLAAATLAIMRLATAQLFARIHGGRLSNIILLGDGVNAGSCGPDARKVDAPLFGLEPDARDPAMLDRLGRVLGGADRIIVSCPPERRQAWARALRGIATDVEILMPEIDALGALGARSHAGRATLLVAAGPLGLRGRMQKRALDLAIAVPALLLLSPLMLLTALAVRLDSPGPVLFRQPRTGRANRVFDMLKFRSMHWEGSDIAGLASTARKDPRVTRVGAFIRRTSLDELPQLWNVVRGEMSLVGPRPHALGSTAEAKPFWDIDERYWDRHALKPGITGLAQVRGFRGATDRREDLTDRLGADLEYLAGWSLLSDIAILARTALVLVHPRAY